MYHRFILLLLSFTFSLNILNSTESLTFKIGYTGNINEAPLFIAKEKGFFKSEGLAVDLVKIEESKITDSLTSKIVDSVLVNPYLYKNIDSIKFAGAVNSKKLEAIIKKDSSIKIAADLQGKRIGIEKINGNEQTAFSLELKKADLDPLEDVRWVELGKDKLKKALERGDIDCFLTEDPQILSTVDNKKLIRLYNMSYDGGYRFYYPYFLGFSPVYINSNLKKVLPLIKVLKKASSWAEKNRRETLNILIKGNYLTGNYKNTGIFDNYGWYPVTEKEKNRFLNYTLEQVNLNLLPSSFDIKSFEKKHFAELKRDVLQEDEVTDYKVAEDCCNYPQ